MPNDFIYKSLSYLKDENYYKLRKNIENAELNFYEGDIFTLVSSLTSKYDLVYLSNIIDYANKKEKVLVWLARFKHVDVVDNASNLDKLRSDGWSFDEIREMVGYPILDTDFSNARALTKNYSTGEEGEGVE